MSKLIHTEWPAYGGDLDDDVWLRIRAAINHEEGDRVPIWDYIDNRATVEHFQQEGEDYADTMVRVYHGLGIDLCRGYGSGFGMETEGLENEEQTSKISGQTSWITKYPISSIEELAAYEPPINDDEASERWSEGILDGQQKLAPLSYFVPGTGVGFHETYALMGQQLFSYAIYDAREHLDRIFETFGHNSTKIAKHAAQKRYGPLFFTWADIAYKGQLLFSPAFLRETFIPMLRNVCEPLNEAGMTVIFHSDGDVTEILDDMVDAGINGLNPIEPMAGMDIAAVKKRYGDELVLVGNIDCSQVIPLGSPNLIRETVKQTLRDAGHDGGLFIGSSSEIVPATPLENVLAFFEACRTYGKYPLKV
jgi:uroporphyrinogen decarboxylase